MWPLRTILFCVLFVFGCSAAVLNPVWGLVTYMAIYQMDPRDTWWGVPVAGLGVRFSLCAALATLVGLVISRRKLPQFPPFSLWEAGLFGMLLIGAVNTVIGLDYGPAARHEFEKFWKVLVFTFVLGRVAAGRQNLKIVLWTLVFGCIYIGFDAHTAPTRAFVLGRLEFIGGPDFSTTSGAAAHLSAMLPLVGAVFLITRSWHWRIAAAISGALTVNAIVLCRTRSAFIGLLVGILVAVLCAPRIRRFRIHGLLVLGGIAAFALTDDNFWTRMRTVGDRQIWETDAATVNRKEIWLAAARIFADHPLGVGAGNFPTIVGKYDAKHKKRSTHNSLVVCFVELGIQGGLVFGMLLCGSLYLLYQCMRLADQSADPLETRMIAYGFLISLATYMVTAMGTQRFYCESFWWILSFPVILHRIVVHEARNAVAGMDEVCEPRAAAPSPWSAECLARG